VGCFFGGFFKDDAYSGAVDYIDVCSSIRRRLLTIAVSPFPARG
jgi:hypothetical protein